VVLLLLDAIDGIVDQDRILAERIAQEGRACIIVLNKWDAIPQKDEKTFNKAVENIRTNLPMLSWAEIAVVSAQTGQRTEKILSLVDEAASQFSRRIPTAVLNDVIQEATLYSQPPRIGSRSGRIYYCMQVATAPPAIVLFVNDPSLFTESYLKFLEKKVRQVLRFEMTPIKFILRGKNIRDISRAAQTGDGKFQRIIQTGKKGRTG
jgi:GTP-binding protein